MVSLAIIVAVYTVPLTRATLYLTYLRLWPSPRQVLGSNNTPPSLVALATTSLPAASTPTVTFDTDGIPFIIDNSATCIICNVRSLFVGELCPENFAVETVHGSASRKRYAGTIRLELVDDAQTVHVHEIPGAIYDPETQFNLIGVTFLAAHFGNGGGAPDDDVDSNGTRITSSGTRSNLSGTTVNMSATSLTLTPPFQS